MLIYARRSAQRGAEQIAKPPQRAIDAVEKLNQKYDDACAAFIEKRNAARGQFEVLRQKLMDIYRSWHISSVEEVRMVLLFLLSVPLIPKNFVAVGSGQSAGSRASVVEAVNQAF